MSFMNRKLRPTGSLQSSFRPKVLKAEDIEFKKAEANCATMVLEMISRPKKRGRQVERDLFKASQSVIKRKKDMTETINAVRVTEWLQKHQTGPVKPLVLENFANGEYSARLSKEQKMKGIQITLSPRRGSLDQKEGAVYLTQPLMSVKED